MFQPGERMDYPDHAEVRIIDDFLPNDMFLNAQEDSQKLYEHGEGFRTNSDWGQHLIKHSAPVMISNVLDNKITDGIASSIAKIGEYQQKTLYQYWPVGSYIPWHNDGGHKAAITIYLSEHDINDGGYLMYDDGRGIKAVRPKPNRAVFITGGLYHCVTTVNTGSAIRRSIQIWLSVR